MPSLDGSQTAPELARWPRTASHHRRYERSTVIGSGAHTWDRVRNEVLVWAVKTRSGFRVAPRTRVSVGDRPTIVAGIPGVTVREPVEVVAVVDRDDRAGFAYRTLPGHPVDGEEAFIVWRDADDVVLTIRSLTRPSPQRRWRLVHPLLRIAQHLARYRYRRALRASTFILQTRASAAPEVLFEASVSIDAHLASMRRSRERAIAGVTSGRIGDGESVTWRARHLGVWFVMTSRITAWDAPRRFVDEQVGGPFRLFRHEHLFEADASGTRMTDIVTLASPLGGLLVERLVLVPYLRRLIVARNRHLVAVTDR